MLVQFNKGLERYLARLLVTLFSLLVMDVLWGVFSRFVLAAQSQWTEELARFLLVWIALLGSAYAFRSNQHLGMDALVHQMHSDVQNALQNIVYIAVITFAIWALIFGGWQVMAGTMDMQQKMVTLPLPKASQYLCLPLSGVIIISFMLEKLFYRQNVNTYPSQGEK